MATLYTICFYNIVNYLLRPTLIELVYQKHVSISGAACAKLATNKYRVLNYNAQNIVGVSGRKSKKESGKLQVQRQRECDCFQDNRSPWTCRDAINAPLYFYFFQDRIITRFNLPNSNIEIKQNKLPIIFSSLRFALILLHTFGSQN